MYRILARSLKKYWICTDLILEAKRRKSTSSNKMNCSSQSSHSTAEAKCSFCLVKLCQDAEDKKEMYALQVKYMTTMKHMLYSQHISKPFQCIPCWVSSSSVVIGTIFNSVRLQNICKVSAYAKVKICKKSAKHIKFLPRLQLYKIYLADCRSKYAIK